MRPGLRGPIASSPVAMLLPGWLVFPDHFEVWRAWITSRRSNKRVTIRRYGTRE